MGASIASVTFTVVPGWKTNLDSPLVEALASIGEAISADAAMNAPVKTGDLRDSVETRPSTNGGFPSQVILSQLEYAGYVEVGTEHMDAQPYLKPALYMSRSL